MFSVSDIIFACLVKSCKQYKEPTKHEFLNVRHYFPFFLITVFIFILCSNRKTNMFLLFLTVFFIFMARRLRGAQRPWTRWVRPCRSCVCEAERRYDLDAASPSSLIHPPE